MYKFGVWDLNEFADQDNKVHSVGASIAPRQTSHEQQTTYKPSYVITSQLTSSFCWL